MRWFEGDMCKRPNFNHIQFKQRLFVSIVVTRQSTKSLFIGCLWRRKTETLFKLSAIIVKRSQVVTLFMAGKNRPSSTDVVEIILNQV